MKRARTTVASALACAAAFFVTTPSAAADAQRPAGWAVYRDAKRGLELAYPAGARLNQRDRGYIRFQNYRDREVDKTGLPPGKFYLEIQVNPMPADCDEATPRKPPRGAGGAEAYLESFPEFEGSDGLHILCAPRGDHVLVVRAASTGPDAPLARRIIDTVRLTAR